MHSGHLSVRVGDSSRGSEEIVESGIVPFNAIIMIIVIIMMMMMIS